MLAVGALLQCHQSVTAAAIGHVIPEVTGLHAVLSDVVTWRHKVRNHVVKQGKLSDIQPGLAGWER